jgi:Cft2 family RNA processing exonuclease
MAESGRILHHLRNRIEDPKNTILITGWQAPDTLGRRIVEGVSPVRIFGEEYRLNAHVEVLNGFSGHADRDELLDWAKRSLRRAGTFRAELEARRHRNAQDRGGLRNGRGAGDAPEFCDLAHSRGNPAKWRLPLLS